MFWSSGGLFENENVGSSGMLSRVKDQGERREFRLGFSLQEQQGASVHVR